ncbi:MAG TPA: hypothetical protein VH393_01120 [Ktedonobacterales bacterium]|jgi:hypothetical protein
MGVWGPGILQDDLAEEARMLFDEGLASGLDVAGATAGVYEDLKEALAGEEDATVIWLALAALQLREGALQAEVRDRALVAIDSPAALSAWSLAPPVAVAARQETLRRFKGILERGICTAEELRAVTDPPSSDGMW